jgi:signal transduction histidine kinase
MNSKGMMKRADRILVGAIVPRDLTPRILPKAREDLLRANRSLRKRTADLEVTNKQLLHEIARLRHLSHRLLSAQEEERKEISRELHDEIAQILTGINAHLAALKAENAANTKGLKQRITRTQRLVQKSVNIVHRFARELRPTMLDDLGLIPTLHSYMKDFTKRTGIRIRFTAYSAVEGMSSSRRTMLYRVAESALTNIAQHAQASLAVVSIRKLPNAVRMEITDDGKGFDVERVLFAKRYRRLGLLGMRERVEMIGGSFAVGSSPGKGTTIRAQIPLKGRNKI